MAKLTKKIKNLLFFDEPQNKYKPFVLEEDKQGSPTIEPPDEVKQENEIQIDKKKRKRNVHKIAGAYPDTKIHTEYKQKRQQKIHSHSEINKNLHINMEYIKSVYNIPANSDVLLREFDISVNGKIIHAFMVFIDGMVDRNIINRSILQPLMVMSNLEVKNFEDHIVSYIYKQLIPQNQISMVTEFQKIIDGVNFGGCGIFIDGLDVALIADVKGWEHRTVDRPNTELVLRGPQEGFTEVLRVNTALIRKILKDENLIVESLEVGKRNKMPCAVMYIKDIANDSLVDEVKKRLKSLDIAYIFDSGELEQLIEDFSFIPATQMLSTERPDRTAALLAEGKVAILVHNSPFALVVPATLMEQLHSAEDAYVRFPYANLLRLTRVLGVLLSLLLPAFYLAITNYHQEMIPTDLLLAIAASRERVPFPSIIEILIMEIAFELIREAGIRIPGPIGPTLGIIGALILGQAAVAANIVSPILIVVVAVTGIGSFAIPSFSLALGFRMLRFAYIFLAGLAGFLGISLGLFLHGLLLVSTKSFGVPFMAPIGPKTREGLAGVVLREPIWSQEERTEYTSPKDIYKQPPVVREWQNKVPGKEDNNDE